MIALLSQSYESALQWVSDAIRDNKEVVLAAVARDGDNFHHASSRLRQDEQMIAVALESGFGLSLWDEKEAYKYNFRPNRNLDRQGCK